MHRFETLSQRLAHIIGDRPTQVTVRSDSTLCIQNHIHTLLSRGARIFLILLMAPLPLRCICECNEEGADINISSHTVCKLTSLIIFILISCEIIL